MHVNDIVKHPRLPAIIWDFMSRVDSAPTERGCRLWLGSADRYGSFSIDSEVFSAHRVSQVLFVGPIDDDLHVLHRCDVPLCVHPAHLFLGTEAVNHADKAAKGRSARGSSNGTAKISESTVIAILAADGRHQDVAKRFGVAKATVSHIKTGRQWASVTGVLPSFLARKPLPILSAFQNTAARPLDNPPASRTLSGTDPSSAGGASSNGDEGI